MNSFRKIFLTSFISLFLFSCGRKIILNNYLKNENLWRMYGRVSERSFFVQDTVRLPLKILYKTELKSGLNYSSVTMMDQSIFIGDTKGYVYKIELNNGRIKNYMNYKQPILTSIIVKENELIIPIAGLKDKKSFIIVYNMIQGNEKKEIVLDGSIEKDPVFIDDQLYVITTNGLLYKFDKDYNIEWKLDLEASINSHFAATKEFIVVGTLDGRVFTISNKGKIISSIKINNSINSGFSINNSLIYFGDDRGDFYCIYENGKILYQKKLGSSFKAIPSFDEEKVFIGDLSGNIFCLNKSNGELIWKKNYGGMINNSILIIGDKLIIPNVHKKIFVLDKFTGDLLQEIEMDGRVKLSPVYVNGKIIVGCDDKKIIALSN